MPPPLAHTALPYSANACVPLCVSGVGSPCPRPRPGPRQTQTRCECNGPLDTLKFSLFLPILHMGISCCVVDVIYSSDYRVTWLFFICECQPTSRVPLCLLQVSRREPSQLMKCVLLPPLLPFVRVLCSLLVCAVPPFLTNRRAQVCA